MYHYFWKHLDINFFDAFVHIWLWSDSGDSRHFSYGRVGDCWTVENVYQSEIPKQLALRLFDVYNICCNTYIIDRIYYDLLHEVIVLS